MIQQAQRRIIANARAHEAARVSVGRGVELAYESFGDGAPLLLIADAGQRMFVWEDAFCRQLAALGFRVIRFDQRDVGLSTRFDHEPVPALGELLRARLIGMPVEAPYSLDDMARDTFGLLDALQLSSAHVVGLSLGGMIAQCMALQQPERVRSLSLLNSASGELWCSLPRALPDTRMTSGAARQCAAALAARPRGTRLRSLQLPTLVLHGARNPLMPVLASCVLAGSIPGARLSIVRDLGHELDPVACPFMLGAIAENTHRRLPERARRAGTLRMLLERKIDLT